MTSHSSSFFKCGRWDLNPHERNAHKILSLARLPVPTLPHMSDQELLSSHNSLIITKNKSVVNKKKWIYSVFLRCYNIFKCRIYNAE